MAAPASLLPPSSTAFERAADQAAGARLAALPSLVASLWTAETCPAALLPYIAWSLSVDEWDDGWGEDKKRTVIAESRTIHQQKGTLAAIRRALSAIGQPEITIIERGDYVFHNGLIIRNSAHLRKGSGGWATYRLVAHNAITIDQAYQIKRLLAAVQRNCITLTAIDFREASLRHNRTAIRNATYSRGVVDTTIS